ncbi:MAG: hypothetical protein EA374_02360 [Acholeplasmatales bacterium]|nr:MAG: hypothetical protein EA374_02360 [Acholeplasmatales bacterium]
MFTNPLSLFVKFLLVWLTLVLLMSSLAVRPVLIQVAGTKVYLQVTPTSVRPNLSLEEIVFRYDVEDIPYAALDRDLRDIVDSVAEYRPLSRRFRQMTVYVSLEQVGAVHTITQASSTRPDDGLYLIGSVTSVRSSDEHERLLVVRYGLPRQTDQADPEGRLLHAFRDDTLVLATVRIHRGHARLDMLHPVSN